VRSCSPRRPSPFFPAAIQCVIARTVCAGPLDCCSIRRELQA
jgi:hypothetical protein